MIFKTIYILLFAFIMMVIDYLVWLRPNMTVWVRFLNGVRNGSPRGFRKSTIFPNYIFLAYLIINYAKESKDSFILGAIVYGVFDFTMLSLFPEYTFNMALKDMTWGTVFIGFSYYLNNFIKNKIDL
jgi:hypothetical protein